MKAPKRRAAVGAQEILTETGKLACALRSIRLLGFVKNITMLQYPLAHHLLRFPVTAEKPVCAQGYMGAGIQLPRLL